MRGFLLFFAALLLINLADADICLLPKKVGPCKAAIPRWWYDASQEECVKFSWGGCRANANNFKTKRQCDQACNDFSQNSEAQRICRLPVANGNGKIQCLAYIPSFYFDVRTRRCVSFIYGGCGGNENRFETLRECEEFCRDLL